MINSQEIEKLKKHNAELRQLVEAYESVFYFSIEELKAALDTMKAYENNAYLSSREMEQRDETHKAFTKLFDYFSQEIKEKFETIEAFENVNELSNREKKNLYPFIASSMKAINSSLSKESRKEVIDKIVANFKQVKQKTNKETA